MSSKQRELTSEQSRVCLEAIVTCVLNEMGIDSLNQLTTMSPEYVTFQMNVSQRLMAGALLEVADELFPETN